MFELTVGAIPVINQACFFKTHRTHIINMVNIKSFDIDKNEIYLTDHSMVPLSRRRYDDFIKALKSTCN